VDWAELGSAYPPCPFSAMAKMQHAVRAAKVRALYILPGFSEVATAYCGLPPLCESKATFVLCCVAEQGLLASGESGDQAREAC